MSKYWCFTLNNYGEEEENTIQSACRQENSNISYLIYGREVGSNGTRHLQGYIELVNRKRINGVKQLLGTDRVHLERRAGSASQAADYCKKDGNIFEHGEISRSEQGKRTDLVELKQSLDSGKDLKDISDDHFKEFIRYERSIRSYISLHSDPRQFKSYVTVYWGETGTGKTRRVFHEHPEVWVYSSDGWFDGYHGQEVVLFDDYGGHEFKLTYLLKLLDRYAMQVRIKGGFTNWRPRKIYITSNKSPKEWYNCTDVHQRALERRLDVICQFQTEWRPPENE